MFHSVYRRTIFLACVKRLVYEGLRNYPILLENKMLIVSEIDECVTYPCHPDATCTNYVGSFECSCKNGFTGSGYVCEGKYLTMIW